jgi:hypothetical protein
LADQQERTTDLRKKE